ncbi:MAG: RHS repeat-associated core domain-containing protein [Flavobacteriales bacterium]|nr:RHS repeat-associated core domain-containing protein [Flavobacteriales bacterium]
MSICLASLFEEVGQSSYNIDKDLWAMKINYNESNSFNTMPLYNGNIASTAWIAKVGDTLQLPVKSYAYQYDEANRLQQANYTERFLSGHHTYSTPHQTGNFDLNNLTYDANGNIKTLQRLSHGFPVDQFSYNYQQNSNKLLRVNDSIVYTFAGIDFVNKPDTSAFYEYDSNGKLSSDNGVSRYTTVTYYSTGMPKKVVVHDKGEIHYIYDAMGTKLAQIPIHENGFSLRRDYLGALELVNGQPEFMHTAEGRALETQEGNYRYEYHLNDHLGNMRLAFSDRNQDGEINHQTEVLQVRDYYPFGQPHVPLGLQIGLKDKYLFNGKELQEDFGLYQYDYGARSYDPQLARWFSVDPLAHLREWVSPYNFVQNNPINRVDPDGALDNPIYGTDGEFLGTDDQGLTGKAIVMDESDFTQGMSHKSALSKNLGAGGLSEGGMSNLSSHYSGLSSRPDYDGFVSVTEGVEWARSHPGALDNPTPDNMLYLDASKLNFGNLSTSAFSSTNTSQSQNLLTTGNLLSAVGNETIRATAYALGRVDMILHNTNSRSVSIVNNAATDYDWNTGGSSLRSTLINAERSRTGLNDTHGFRTFYYGKGTLNKPFVPKFPTGPKF